MNDYRDFFMKEKPVRALMVIGNAGETYCSEISKDIDSTYAHTVKTVSKMEDLGLIETRKEGRKKVVKLSKKGSEYLKIFSNLSELYEERDTASGQKLRDNSITK